MATDGPAPCLPGCMDPTKLVDAAWLCRLADAGDILPRCQDVPAAAKVTLDEMEVWRDQHGGHTLGVLAISYPWLAADHPDPRGEQLRSMAFVLRAFAEKASKEPADGGHGGPRCRVGVFWDYCSLPQRSRRCAPEEDDRSESDREIFLAALQGINDWYAHPKTFVLLATMPLPTGAEYVNRRPYDRRGWCVAERAMTQLVKDSNCLIDLSKLTGDETEIFGPGSLSWHGKAERRPPVSPSVFSSMLARGVEDGEISFTKRGDVPLVSEIYKRAFVSQLRETTELNYFSFGWTDVEAEAFAEFLHSASTSEVGLRVHSIYLGLNHIGEHGMLCISDALVRGAVPALKKLYLGGNQVTAAAREALTRARPSLVLGGVEETQTHERRVRDAALREDDEPAERPRSNGTTAKAAKASVSCTAL
eukprot:TRINITY_DN46493_c0_g1_i5.p1 TRINITY_DN46493_c0_g1~~TRINITY_DN46493_c0_g1_i5.p1  ORF type:complete len:420 (+),score=72.85 TRINITY_DN46493_c0_g1_i5:88-1347(+)